MTEIKKALKAFEKYFAKFTKETIHQGGSIPFWDWTYSGCLKIKTVQGTEFWLRAAELIELKKLLAEFDGRTGMWKNKDTLQSTSQEKQGDKK